MKYSSAAMYVNARIIETAIAGLLHSTFRSRRTTDLTIESIYCPGLSTNPLEYSFVQLDLSDCRCLAARGDILFENVYTQLKDSGLILLNRKRGSLGDGVCIGTFR